MRAAKIDDSQRELVPWLLATHGATFQSCATLGKGAPDGILGFMGVTAVVEFKTNPPPPKTTRKAPRKRKATRTEEQQAAWAAKWRGSPRVILRTQADCLALLNQMHRQSDAMAAAGFRP
jgi:hypothetical protein